MPDYLIKEETLTNIANMIRSKTGTIEKINPDDMDDNIENIVTLAAGTADATAVTADLLTGKTAYVNGNKITGSMTNNGAVSPSALNAGGSYTIPAGYHNGNGKITANSLASQTSATATAANIASGKTAWVNGSKLTGTLSGGTIKVTSTIVENSNDGEFSYTAPTGRTLFKDCFPIPLFETYYNCRSTSRSGAGTRPLEPTISGNTITWPSETVYISGLVTTPYYRQYVSSITVYFIDVTI